MEHIDKHDIHLKKHYQIINHLWTEVKFLGLKGALFICMYIKQNLLVPVSYISTYIMHLCTLMINQFNAIRSTIAATLVVQAGNTYLATGDRYRNYYLLHRIACRNYTKNHLVVDSGTLDSMFVSLCNMHEIF